MRIRFIGRKKQNKIDNTKEEFNQEKFIKELEEHIKWIKEKQKKSEEEK